MKTLGEELAGHSFRLRTSIDREAYYRAPAYVENRTKENMAKQLANGIVQELYTKKEGEFSVSLELEVLVLTYPEFLRLLRTYGSDNPLMYMDPFATAINEGYKNGN